MKKYINKKIKINDSDIFDGLIITTLPYVNIFITEKQNASLLKEMKNNSKIIQNLRIYKYGELKKIAT